MSEEFANVIALWILLPALGLTILAVGATSLGTRRGVRDRRRQQEFEIDWGRYREIPKVEIITMLGEHGWVYRGEELADTAWLLRFALGPAEAHGQDRETTSRQRIAIELNAAEPDELRQAPPVVERVKEIKREKDLGPLSPAQSNWARERHEHWAKRFNRQVALAFFYGIFGVIILFGTLGSFGPADGNRFYVMLAIAVVMLLLLGMAVLKAVLVRRKRRAELGDFLNAYGELNTLAENEQQTRQP